MLVMSVDTEEHVYSPILYLNEFWHLKDRRVKLESQEESLQLILTFAPISLYKLQMLVAFDHSFRLNESLFDGDDAIGGIDSIKVRLGIFFEFTLRVGIAAEYGALAAIPYASRKHPALDL